MKKGFTLIELLAVLTIISLLLVVVMPNITGTSNSAKEKMYETKKESILKAYKLCTSDGVSNCNKIKTLLTENYIVSDNINSTCTTNCIKNPVTNTYLDDCTINSSGTDIVC